LLSVSDLRVSFDTPRGLARAVDGVNLRLEAGRTLCIVGESGCGKSMTALALMGLVPQPAGRVSGSIELDGQELIGLPARELADLRGDRIAMVFQEPMTSLNPSMTVGRQLTEVLERHRGLDAEAAREEAIAMLRRVRIPAPEQRFDDYPHRMSGGMRQRVMIAMALLCRPRLLVADEPTTALDVTIQAQVLALVRELREETGTAVLLITHDLGVVAGMADRVAVMYAGQVVEEAEVTAIFDQPQHPYTVGLLGAVPALRAPGERLVAIDGRVPEATAMPAGCRFAGRCPFADRRCVDEAPAWREVEPGHHARCWKAPLQDLAATLPPVGRVGPTTGAAQAAPRLQASQPESVA
jgi:oligopeptide/dipeptide ABC transporter ATP-binding protein